MSLIVQNKEWKNIIIENLKHFDLENKEILFTMPIIVRQEKQYLAAIEDENINLKTIFSKYCDIADPIFEKFKIDNDCEKFSIRESPNFLKLLLIKFLKMC